MLQKFLYEDKFSFLTSDFSMVSCLQGQLINLDVDNSTDGIRRYGDENNDSDSSEDHTYVNTTAELEGVKPTILREKPTSVPQEAPTYVSIAEKIPVPISKKDNRICHTRANRASI